jgi:hypothetical protein
MARSNKSVTPATDAEIRAAFRDGIYKPSSDALLPALAGGSFSKKEGYKPSESGLVRGRLGAAAREDFTAVTGRPAAGEGVKMVSTKTVEIPMVSQKTGRPIKPRVILLSEAKALAGVPDKKGRLSAAEVEKVAAALS